MDPERLAVIPLFAELEPAQRVRVASHVDEVDIELGKVLTEQSDLATRFFVIAEGLAAFTTDDGFVALLGPGDAIGEMGAIRRARRSANVVAITRMRVLSLMAWELRDLAEEIPQLASRLQETIDRRLEEMGTTSQP